MWLVERSGFGLNELLCGDCTKPPWPPRACSCHPKARISGRHLATRSAGSTEIAGWPTCEDREPPDHEATESGLLPKRTDCDEDEHREPIGRACCRARVCTDVDIKWVRG